jgi:hypothetical protein
MRPYPEPTRSRVCSSDLRFDARFAGELSGAEALAMDAHLAGCARCRERHERLRSEREHFLLEYPALAASGGARAAAARDPEPAARALGRRPRWLLALAAAALALALLPRARWDGPSERERSKGSPRIGFFIKRGEQVRRGIDGERVRARDRLRFVYTSDEPRRLLLLGIDGKGRVDVYWSRAVAAGQEQALPSAIELDNAPGEEHLIALFCREPLDEAALRRELATTGELHTPADCLRDEIMLTKIED